MKSTAWLIAAVMALSLTIGCSKAGIVRTEVFKDGKDQVSIAGEVDKDENIIGRGYEHPAVLEEALVRSGLELVEFQEFSFFTWRKSKRVFIESEVDKLAPVLVDAFAQLKADQWIEFSVTARKRDYLWRTPRVTDGWMFIDEGRLNIVLNNLNFELIDYDERQLGDPRKNFTIASYRLVTDENMVKPEIDKSEAMYKYEHANWIKLDLSAVPVAVEPELPEGEETVVSAEETEPVEQPESEAAPEAAAETAPEAVEPSAGQKEIKDRLTELQELLDAGLITEEEYELKRKEILEDL